MTKTPMPDATDRVDAHAAPWRRPRWGVLAVVAPMALLAPWLLLEFSAGNFYIHLLILIMLWAVVAQSWNLVLGVSGIYSFAQIALFASGGWITGVLSMSYGWNPWLSLILSPIVATIAALVIGLPSLRLRGIYVVLLTLGFHELLRNYVTTGPEVVSGGGYGLIGVPRLPYGDLFGGSHIVASYYSALVLFAVATWTIWRIFYSPIGVAFSALRDSEGYAVGRGINQFRIKLFLFGFSAFFTGLAGGLMTHYLGSISQTIFAFSVLINVLAMIVIGGWGSFGGPIFGAALLISLQEGLRDLADYRTLGLGLLLVLMAVVAPRGLWPRMRDAFNRFLEEPEDRRGLAESTVEEGVANDASEGLSPGSNKRPATGDGAVESTTGPGS
jgi:branched-chain amino acid transport system permease protein